MVGRSPLRGMVGRSPLRGTAGRSPQSGSPRRSVVQTRPMGQQVVVCGFEDEKSYSLFCEPEGAELEVRPGDQLTITFHGSALHGFELAWMSRGLVLCRLDDGDVTIADKAGRDLCW
jgi:hypothetical protein